MNQFLTTNAQFISQETILLLNQQILLMPNWKWLALIAILVLGYALRPAIEFILHKIKLSLPQNRIRGNFIYFLLQLNIEQSLSWMMVGGIWLSLINDITTNPNLEKYVATIIRIMIAFQFIKLGYRSVEAFSFRLQEIVSKTESKTDDQLAPLATTALRVFVVVVGILMILQNLGVNVTTLIAGLGLGGMAIAFAAQKTVENVFGSITILIDSPFQIGDYVKIGDTEGIVENIGFRSTRIRTFYNSLVSIPNANVATDKIDNMGLRPARRCRQVLGLHYDTPPEAIMEFCKSVKYIILQDEKVIKDSISVFFNGYGDSTLNVLVSFHLQINDNIEEFERQQRIFCDILKLAKDMKVEFAYPTRTIYQK